MAGSGKKKMKIAIVFWYLFWKYAWLANINLDDKMDHLKYIIIFGHLHIAELQMTFLNWKYVILEFSYDTR